MNRWVTLILTIPVLLFSATIQDWLSFNTPEFADDQFIAPLLSIITFAYGGPHLLEHFGIESSAPFQQFTAPAGD